MKLIHCADLHLDSKMNRYLTAEQSKERNAELLHTFRRMVHYAKINQVRGILIAGDLFDTEKVSATTKQVILNEIFGNKQIDFYYLRGNHDRTSFLLEEVPENLHLFGNQWTSYVVNSEGLGNVVVTGVELSRENNGYVYQNLKLHPEQFHIVMLHGQEVAHQGKEDGETISIPALRNKGIDYLALGHIHSYKEAKLDYQGAYCYAGCLEGRGFDECGEHGFVLVDIDEQTLTCTREFIPFAKRNLYEVEIDISLCETSSQIMQVVENALQVEQYGEECLLKLILTGEVSVECEKNLNYIQQYFQQKYYFVKVEDQTKCKVNYQAYQFDESLKGEFVRMVLSDESLDEDEKARIIRYGICALAGEEL